MKMITDLQDDVVTPDVMQLGDGPLTDIGVEPGSVLSDEWDGVSDAITMQAQSAERERKMQQLVDVAFAKAGDKEAARRVESDALLGWALTAEAAADAENTEDVLGTQLARRYGTGDPGAVWDAMNASADYEYEQMPVWNTRAEGMRLVWGRFQKMVQGKKAAADAAQAAVNERLKGLKAFVDGKDAKRDAGGKLADDAITDGRLWEMVNKGVLELADVQRAQKVREFMRRYVRPLGKRAEMDERMRGLDGLRDEVYELIGEDKDTARVFYESLMRWAGEQRGKNDTGAGDEFQVAVGKKLSDWARAVDEVAPLALLSVGAPGPVSPALVEQAVGTYERRRERNEKRRLSAGVLRAAVDEAMKVQEGGWWQSVKNAPRVAAVMAGDTLPYLVPVVGAGLGTADAFVRGFTSGIDAKVLDAELGGNQGGWESRKAMGNAAMVESGIQALVELMPWSRVGGKGLAASVGRKMKAVTGGKYVPGALSRALARGTQKSVTRALVAEFGANVVTEGVLEPIAQGALTLTAEGVMDLAGVEHGRSKSFSEAFAELGEIWEPEQLAGFLMFSAALTAPAYGQARKNVQLYQANVKKFAKNAEVWEAQGLSRAEAEEAAGAEDALERGNELVAEGWKNDPAGMTARMRAKHEELKAGGRTLVFAGVGGQAGLDAEAVKLLGEAWRASKDKYHLPDVELLGDGRVRLTRAEIPGVVEGIDLTLTEEQADAFLFQELNRLDVERMRDWQKSGGNVEEYEGLQTKLAGLVDVAMGDVAVDAAVAEGSMDVEEMGKGLPEELRGLIKEAGGMNLGVAKKISEWAIGQMEALEAGGMSRAEAREQVASADGGATLGVLAGMGASMQKRLEAAGDMRLRSALNRRRGGRRVAFNGRSVLGSVLVHARGGATGMNAVEDISESVFDMMVQGRTEAILENQAAARKAAGEAERPATLTEVRAAEEQAWKELAEVARKAREALLKVDPDLAIEEVNGDRLNTIEALSTMAMSRYLGSGVLPRWMSGLVDVMRKNVQAAAAVVQLQKAMVALGEQDAGALKDLLEFLDDAGVQVGKSLAGARVEAVADRIRELARWHAGADAAGPGGVGGMSVSQAQEEVLEEEDEIQQNDKAREAVAAAKPADAAKREDAEDKRMFEPEAGRGAVPERMRGVFVGDAAVYNAAGDFWCGQVEKNKLSDGTEQVKVGEKGKHGVIAGKELTGRFVNDTAPILVWKRRDGSLQVISGRHRFAKLMEDESATGVMCYVYEESEERDERWARMKDYEQNMRDDQADEVTCAVYARETGLTEAEMRERGLTRNGSRSKRGIFIGQHAREELWTRFRNGEIKPIDAELVCKLTAALADQSQVAEIQAHCCGLLKAGKSWDYIGASVQLMASSQAQQAEQMLLDLGADFTADLERMARWVELCRKAFREAIDLLKDEKRRVKKGAKASRLGLSATMTEEKREEMLGDLEAMDAKFEMIGSYPELVAEAKMWDGDESKFADPVAMYLERVEAMQAEGLQEEQARREAEEATGMFNWSSSLTGGSPAQNIDASMSGGYPKGSIIYINGREVDLSQCYAIDSSGNKLNKDDFITTPAGNINWYEFPSDEHTRQMMKKKGVKILPVRLRVGVQQKTSGAGGYGFMHVMKHYNQMVDMNPSESPLMHLFNTLTGKLSITKNGILRKTMDSANNGQARKLVIELKEDEGFYSIVSSYPVSYYPRESNGIAIKGVYLKFMPGRAASGLNESNQADSTTPESTGVTGQSLTGSIPKNAKSVNIYDLKILEKDGALVFQQKQEEKVNLASYSVTGGKNLAAVHSLNAEKFLAAVELGGMPMPSVAVTRLDRPYEWGGAGAINLIGKPEMVDPRKGADVYSRDAWTGNFPRVEHKVIGKKDRSDSVTDLFHLKKKYQEKDDYNSAIHQLDYRINMDYGGDQTGRSDMDYALRQRTGKALFAWQSGYRPRPKMKDAERVHKWLTKEVAGRLRRYVALSPDEYHEKWTEIKEEVRLEIEKVYRESSVITKAPTLEVAEKRLSSWVNVALRAFDAYSPSALAKELDDVKKIDARVLDVEANLDMLAKYADKHKKAYEAWIEQKLNTWFSKESYIRGTRKEATLDNLTEYMLESKARGEEKGLAFGSGLVRAHQSERLYSLEDIRERRETLTDSDSSKAMKEKANEWMNEWREGVVEILARGGVGDGFTVRDDAMKTLSKVKGTPTAEKLRSSVRKMFRGANNLQALLNDAEVINAGVEALKSLRAELEDYMEAIPQRAVKMDEWEYAVLPVGLKKNKAVVAALRENGIKPVWHDGTEEGRRAALAGLVDNPVVSFSVIGRNARTWGKYTDRAFVGRDDGMWRAEIDASQAKLKKASMHQTDDSLVREMEKRLAFFREKVEERGRWEPVSKLWAAGEYGVSTSGEMGFLMSTLRGAGVEFESLHQMVERGVFSIVLESDAAAAAKRLLRMVEIPGVEGFNRLGEMLDFPELYEAYPELKKVPVRWMDDNFRFRGIFSTEGVFKEAFIAVKRSRTDGGKLSTLLHEVQHWIQKHEGFAFGSPGGVKEHRVSAGEIEARNVQARRWMTADERAELPFNETLEYPGEALVTYSIAAADNLRQHYAENPNGTPPEGWWVHGRRGQDNLNTEHVLQLTRRNEVGEQYAGSNGSVWYIRPKANASILDTRNPEHIQQLRNFVKSELENYDSPIYSDYERVLLDEEREEITDKDIDKVLSHFIPQDIVNSAEAYDNHEWVLRLWDALEVGFIITPDGAVVLDPMAIEAVRVDEDAEYPGEALVTYSVQRKRDLTLDGERVTKKEAWDHLEGLAGKPLRNARSQFVAVVNKPQRKELTNIGKALVSDLNGFSVETHYAAVGRIDKLFLHAVPCGVYKDKKHGDTQVVIHRFACPLMVDGEKAVAWLTAKETKNVPGNERLYNLELVDIEKLAGTLENLASHRLQDDLPSASRDIVAEVEDAFKTYFEDEPEAGNNFSASLTGAAAAGRRVLEESGDEYVANRLQEAWQKNLEKWSVLHAGKADANSAMRAVMEMEGLVKATYDVVQDDVKLGRLYMLQRWAMVYARMVESGEIPPKGALKGQAYEKFVERLAEQQRTERRRGMSREQAEELVKELGVTRLEGAMEKVARECMRAAEWHLKQKETARVKRLLEAAWPKREEGKKSPRGKLSAREYRRLEWIAKVMEFSGEDKYKETQRIIREIDELPQELVGYEERVAELEGKLAALDPKQADYVERKAELDKAMRELNPNEVGYDEAKAELEDQLNWLHVFGGWAEMDVSQARKAARALEDLLLRGYTEWERKVQRERERTRRVADEISAHFKAPWYATRMERKKDSDKAGTNKAKMLKGMAPGLMSYAQLMLSLRKKLGNVFCDRQRRTIAEAHRNLLTAQKDLQDWSAIELQKITGLTGAALEQWIAGNNQNVNTGIMMQQVRSERIRMNAKEVDRLGAMSEKEYEAWRDGELAKAEADGRAVVLPTAEELLVLRGLRLEKPRRKWLEVERTEQQAVELVATKEAMLYAVLLFEQPDYEHLVEAHGLSWADVGTMKKLIGPKLLRWGYAMRRHLNENGELLAAKYEAWNGTPFGRRANYFRGVFDVNKLAPEVDIQDDAGATNTLGGNKYSILIPRRYHRQQINWQVGASQVFLLTMNEQNNYIHTQHITREWRQLLSRKWFADGLAAEVGASVVNAIKAQLNVIDAAPNVDAAMSVMFSRFINSFLKAAAISSLALNVYSYMKQVSCLLNAIVGGYVPDAAVKQSGVYQVLTYSGIGAGELVRSYARVLSGRGAVSFKEMTGSAVIQSRIQSGGKRVADALMMRTGQAMPNAVGRAGEVSGEWALEQMDMIDRKANTVSAMVVADAVYRKLAATEGGKEAGDKWVRAQAVEAAGLMVDLVAQPKLRTQKGLWASGRMFGGIGNFLYMFRSETLAKVGTYLAQMMSGEPWRALGGYASMGVLMLFVNLLCQFIKGQVDGDDMDEWEDVGKLARKGVADIMFNDLSSLPVVGGSFNEIRAFVGGGRSYQDNPFDVVDIIPLAHSAKKVTKAVDKDGFWSFKAMRAICNALRESGGSSGWGIGTGSAASSSACGIILGAAVIGNAGRFVLDVAERLTEE